MVYVAFQAIYNYKKFTHWKSEWQIQAKRVKHRSSNNFSLARLRISTRNLDEVKTNAIYFLSFSLWSNFNTQKLCKKGSVLAFSKYYLCMRWKISANFYEQNGPKMHFGCKRHVTFLIGYQQRVFLKNLFFILFLASSSKVQLLSDWLIATQISTD